MFIMTKKTKITNNIIKLFNVARQEASKSNCKKAQVSAIITDYKLRQIYAKDHNRNFYGSKSKFSIHAEEGLLSSWRKPLDNKVLFVYRKKATGIGTSRPCDKCMKLIKLARIGHIMYFDKDINLVVERV